MSRPREIPEGAEIIRSYTGLRWFFDAFAANRFTLLIVVGRPGLSKSLSIKEILKRKPLCYIQGRATPIQVYIKLFENKDLPVILDDAEGLYGNSAGRNMLTSLTQTDEIKTMDWLSSTKILEDANVPKRFATSSRVCVITNRWAGSQSEIQALEDRGHLVFFDPTADEIHRYVGTWLRPESQDVFNFIGANLHLISRPSCRLYVKAVERKAAGGDWKEYVLHHCHDIAIQVVQQLIDDPTFRTEEDRVAEAASQVGISRATYFRYKKELTERGQISPVRPIEMEKITLKPQAAPLEAANAPIEHRGRSRESFEAAEEARVS